MDEEPLTARKRLFEDMSIDELREKIVQLTGEIELCNSAIEKKQASLKAAEAAFFKS